LLKITVSGRFRWRSAGKIDVFDRVWAHRIWGQYWKACALRWQIADIFIIRSAVIGFFVVIIRRRNPKSAILLIREHSVQPPALSCGRKVRAPQGRMQEKFLRVWTQGKCSRKYTAH